MPSKEEKKVARLSSEEKRAKMAESFRLALKIPKFTKASAKLLAQSIYIGLTLKEKDELADWIAAHKDRSLLRERLSEVLRETEQLLNGLREGKLVKYLAEDIQTLLQAKPIVEKREREEAVEKAAAGKKGKPKPEAAKTETETQDLLKEKIRKSIEGPVFNLNTARFLAHLFKDLKGDKRLELQKKLLNHKDFRKLMPRLDQLEQATHALERKPPKPPEPPKPKKPKRRRPR